MVIFTSDHGDWMGDHGLMLKGPLHYQGLIRVPFIVADPRNPGPRRVGNLAGSLDVARSILARAGLAAPNGMQGENLSRLWSGEPPSRDRHGILIENDTQRPQLGYPRPLRVRSYVTNRHRVSIFSGIGFAEAYDLVEDPDESRNLWDEPSFERQRSELLNAWLHEMIAHQDQAPLPTGLA